MSIAFSKFQDSKKDVHLQVAKIDMLSETIDSKFESEINPLQSNWFVGVQ